MVMRRTIATVVSVPRGSVPATDIRSASRQAGFALEWYADSPEVPSPGFDDGHPTDLSVRTPPDLEVAVDPVE